MRYLLVVVIASITFAQVPTLDNLFSTFDSSPYLTPTDSPTNSIYINWNTEAAESTIVAYGTNASLEDTVRVSGIRNYHHVMLTDLLPETEYLYQIVPGGNIERFASFPTHAETLSFIAFGDTRSDSSAHHSVIHRMTAYDFNLVVHSGDLVNNGNTTSDWRIFFHVEDTVLQNYHFAPTIGNHESPYWPYDTLFALPDSEDYYAVDFGNSHFVQLNTEMDLYGAQRDWLIDDLSAASTDTLIDWIFVAFHRPPYSSGSHGSQMDVRNAWCPLFETYGVDIVFTGHDHHYERTVPINGVVYIVTGGGGAPLRDVDSSSWTAYSEKTYHFCLTDITERKLFLKAIKPDGTVFDTLVIDKTIGIEETATSYSDNLSLTPNPFVHKLTISYAVPAQQHVSLKICDSVGRCLKTLVNGTQSSGVYTLSWGGIDEFGGALAAGTYFLIFEHGTEILRHKIVKIDR
jgi:hypothetical protein